MNHLNRKLKKVHKLIFGLPEPPSAHAGWHAKDKTMDALSDVDMFIKDMEHASRRRWTFLYVSWIFICLVLGVLLGVFIYWAYILWNIVHSLFPLFFAPLTNPNARGF